MIYFLQAVSGGSIKIGFSDNVERRHRQLENFYGRPLVLLATMDGDTVKESEIHARFDYLRLGLTEQFQPARELMEFIGVPCPSDAGYETVEVMEPRPGMDVLIALKCRQEFKDWVSEFARKLRTTPSQLVDRALTKLAEVEGFKEPPER